MARNNVGRPTRYKPTYCELLINHMSKGLSYEAFAAVINVSRKTLYNWEDVDENEKPLHPEWLEAKERGYDLCQLFWERIGINGTLGVKTKDIDYSKVNPTMWIFNMKNRFAWKDRMDVTTDEEKLEGSTVVILPSNEREKEHS